MAQGDVAFPPDPERANGHLFPGSLSYVVSDMPQGVSYHEIPETWRPQDKDEQDERLGPKAAAAPDVRLDHRLIHG